MNAGLAIRSCALTLNVKARTTPAEKTNDKAPDFRIYAGRTDHAE